MKKFNIPNILEIFSNEKRAKCFAIIDNFIFIGYMDGNLGSFKFEDPATSYILTNSICKYKKIHDDCINQLDSFNPNMLISCSDDGSIKIWDFIEELELKKIFKEDDYAISGFIYSEKILKFIYVYGNKIKLISLPSFKEEVEQAGFEKSYLSKLLKITKEERILNIHLFKESWLFIGGYNRFFFINLKLKTRSLVFETKTYLPKFIDVYKSIVYISDNTLFDLKLMKKVKKNLNIKKMLFGKIINNYFIIVSKKIIILNLLTNSIVVENGYSGKPKKLLFFNNCLILFCTSETRKRKNLQKQTQAKRFRK